jgi:hypothetical protein
MSLSKKSVVYQPTVDGTNRVSPDVFLLLQASQGPQSPSRGVILQQKAYTLIYRKQYPDPNPNIEHFYTHS